MSTSSSASEIIYKPLGGAFLADSLIMHVRELAEKTNNMLDSDMTFCIEVEGKMKRFAFVTSVPMGEGISMRFDSNIQEESKKLAYQILQTKPQIDQLLIIPYGLLNCSQTEGDHSPLCYDGNWSVWKCLTPEA